MPFHRQCSLAKESKIRIGEPVGTGKAVMR